MPFALIIVGAVLLIVAVRNRVQPFFTQVTADLTNGGNFKGSYAAWAIALLIVGVVGYLPSLQKLSRVFLVLIVIAIVLSQSKNGGTVL